MNTCLGFIPCFLLNIIADFVECQPRIIGGEKGELSTFPFAVHISIKTKNFEGKTGSSGCTGSLISLEWVLSASHCFYLTGMYVEEFEVSNYISIFNCS